DAEDLEAWIDHATLLHDSGEETSLFFVSPVADTVGTEHVPRLQLRGGIGDHEEVVDELTLAPENRIAAGDRETRNEIDRLIDGRRAGYSLPSPFYASPDFFARDREAIFASTWIFAASVAEVPEAGDFVTVDIGTYSVIIIRDDDGAIRAHHKDRKSTRLNSSHVSISYAVLCLKKKKREKLAVRLSIVRLVRICGSWRERKRRAETSLEIWEKRLTVAVQSGERRREIETESNEQ